MKDLRPLVDCDGLIYRCGFTVKEGDPLEFSFAALKKTLEWILFEFKQDPLLVLSGKTNFRDRVATIKPYKGNRINAPKPEYYNEMREYLVERWGAVLSVDEEADDVLGQQQWTTPDTCIVSQDKDMKTIRGHHYNWVKKKHFTISQLQADLFLLWQVIQGDRTDNIPGLKGFGQKTATKIIQENNKNIGKIKQHVAMLYKREFRDKYLEALDEITTLLFIRREPGKTYKDYIGSW